jgi:hypothetical protein
MWRGALKGAAAADRLRALIHSADGKSANEKPLRRNIANAKGGS